MNRAIPARIVIRAAGKSDLPALRKLERAEFTSHAISDRQMSYLVQAPNSIFFVATSGNELAGDAIALLRRHQSGRVSGRIYSLVVDPNHRGQKVGKKLMVALMRAIKGRGAKRVYLEVQETNHGAVALYLKLGFQIIKPLKHYYGRGKHGIHMRCMAGEIPPGLVIRGATAASCNLARNRSGRSPAYQGDIKARRRT